MEVIISNCLILFSFIFLLSCNRISMPPLHDAFVWIFRNASQGNVSQQFVLISSKRHKLAKSRNVLMRRSTCSVETGAIVSVAVIVSSAGLCYLYSSTAAPGAKYICGEWLAHYAGLWSPRFVSLPSPTCSDSGYEYMRL